MNEPFLSDTPAADPSQDRFRRLPFARRIAEALARRKDPNSLVVAINGKWGEGKSTVLEYVHEFLCSQEEPFHAIVPVRFNPWRFENETDLIRSFFQSVAEAVDKSPKTLNQRLGEKIKKYGSLFDHVNLKVGEVELGANGAVSQFGAILAESTILEERKRIEQLLESSSRKLVVFVDDVDRLTRHQIQCIVRLLKLTANLRHVDYVVAFDREVVARALDEQYGESGERYLEKLIQVSLNIPIADRSVIAQMCHHAIAEALLAAGVELSPEARSILDFNLNQFLIPEIANVRVVKQFGNSLIFTLPLLAGEVNTSDLVLLEALKFILPEIYADIRDNPQIYTGEYDEFVFDQQGHTQRVIAHLGAIVEPLMPREKECLKGLLRELFPHAASLLDRGNLGPTASARDRKAQRVRAGHYLKRYLSFTIPDHDISDQEIAEVQAALESPSGSLLPSAEKNLRDPQTQDLFVTKLFSRLDSFQEIGLLNLVRCLGELGDLACAQTDLYNFGNRVGYFVRDSLGLVTPSRRLEATLSMLGNLPLRVACTYAHALVSESDDPSRVVLSKEEQDRVTGFIAARISEEARANHLNRLYPDHFFGFLWDWQRGSGSSDVIAHTSAMLLEDPHIARVILERIAPARSAVGQNEYLALSRIVDVKLFLKTCGVIGLLPHHEGDWHSALACSLEQIHQGHES